MSAAYDRRLRAVYDAFDGANYKAADKAAATALSKHPNDPTLLALRSHALKLTGKGKEAVACATVAARSESTTAHALDLASRVLVAGGQAREAASAWVAAATRSPQDEELQLGLFEAGCLAQDWAAAQAGAMRLAKMGSEGAWRAAIMTVLQAEGVAEAAEARGEDPASSANNLHRRLAVAMVGKLTAGAEKLTVHQRAVAAVVSGWSGETGATPAPASSSEPVDPWEAVDTILARLLPLPGEEAAPASSPLADRLEAAAAAIASAGDPASRPALLAAVDLGRRRLMLEGGEESASSLATSIAAYVAASGAAAPAAAADVRRAVGVLADTGGQSGVAALASALTASVPCPPPPSVDRATGWAAVLAAEQVKADAGWEGGDARAVTSRLLTLATSALGDRAGDTAEAASPTTAVGVELACLGAGVLLRAAVKAGDLAEKAALVGAATGIIGAATAAAPRSPPALLAQAAVSSLAAHAAGTADACKALELKHVLLDSLAGHLAGPAYQAAGDAGRTAGLAALSSTFHSTARPEVGGAIKAACDAGHWAAALDLAAFARRLGRSHARAAAAAANAVGKVWKSEVETLPSAADAAAAEMDAALPDGTPPLSTAAPGTLASTALRLTFTEDLRDRPAWLPPPGGGVTGCEVAAWWEGGPSHPATRPFASQWWARSGGAGGEEEGAVAWRAGRRGVIVCAWLLPRLVRGALDGDDLSDLLPAWEASLPAGTLSPDMAALTALWRAVKSGGGGDAAASLEAAVAVTAPALKAAMAVPGPAIGSASGPALGVARVASLAGVLAKAWGQQAAGLGMAAKAAAAELAAVARAGKAAWWGGEEAGVVASSIIAAQPGLEEFAAASGDAKSAACAVVAALEGGVAAVGAVSEAGRKK